MTPTTLTRGDAELRVFDTAVGYPVVFQHGLGGDEVQVRANFPDGPAFRRITVECRAQGGSSPGTTRPFSIAVFSDDVLAAADTRGVGRFVAGGISMGAAIALRLAVRHPDRVSALILARPAWVDEAAPGNMRPYAEVARLLHDLPPDAARSAFAASGTAARLRREAPDNLVSLDGFFGRPDSALTATLLADIAADGPGVSAEEIAAIGVPTLVIGHGIDLAHPLTYAEALAGRIPHAELAVIPPKATDKAAHTQAFRAAVAAFLDRILPDLESHP